MELSELCQELKNWFDVERRFGKFEISDGSIDLSDILSENQYFRIIGSVFNDGVHNQRRRRRIINNNWKEKNMRFFNFYPWSNLHI